MIRKLVYILLAFAILAVGYVVLYGGSQDAGTFGFISSDIPDPYYLELRTADVNNPDDVIRYGSSIRNHASDLDVFERAAFYEWYFKSHGFDVSLAYAQDFGKSGEDHAWLLVKTKKGEFIRVDPSYREVGGVTMLPLNPEYAQYDQEFGDIYEASERLGANKWDWWKDKTARKVLDENVLLGKKEEAMKKAAE